jgi:predicted AAA+ superfamily ATPase
MEIARDKYLEDLKLRMGNGMIKVITGIRRCGKTYLLFELFKRYLRNSGVDDAHIVELALDSRDNVR